MSWLRRLRPMRMPPAFTQRLAADERALAAADGLLATSQGLWLPEASGHRRVGWHLLSKAVWAEGTLTVTEARETETVDTAIVLEDRRPRRFRLEDPGRLPAVVRARVTDSVRSSHHRTLPGGGAWVMQRKVPGVGGVTLQVRPDPGTDAGAVRELAAAMAEGVRRLRAQ